MKKIRSNLGVSITISMIMVLVLVTLIAGEITYRSFGEALMSQYEKETYWTAMAALTFVDGDQFEKYLDTKGQGEEYKVCFSNLQNLCNNQYVTMIYIIIPDKDYKHITNVFNTVSKYADVKPWEIGHRTKTTNDEYEKAYRRLYEGETDSETVIRNTEFTNTGAHMTRLVSVREKDGVKGILCVEKAMTDLDQAQTEYIQKIAFMLIVMTLLLAGVYGLFLYYRLLQPLKIITQEARRFALETTMPEKPLGNVIKNIDEIGVLARSIDKMTEDTLNNLDRITEAARLQQSIDTQLDIARRIQLGMVPEASGMTAEGFEIQAISHSAKTVGGDLYDYFTTENGKVFLIIGDVSGKGLGPALFMAMTKTMIRDLLIQGFSPARTLNQVNDRLCKQNPENLFVSVFAAVLDVKSGSLTYANAGHNPPIRLGEKPVFMEVDSGIALGLFEDSGIVDYEISMAQGEGLVLYTDGVTESVNEAKVLFGENRLEKALEGVKTAKDAIGAIDSAVKIFSQGCAPFDDLTVLAVFYKG